MKNLLLIFGFVLINVAGFAQPCDIEDNIITVTFDTICSGSDVQINGSIPSGNGNYTYSWLESTVGIFGPYTLIADAANSSYLALGLNSNRWYKRIVDVTCSITETDSDTSAAIAITVQEQPTIDVGPPIQAICQGETSVALGGSFGGSATGSIWVLQTSGTGSINSADDAESATFTASSNAPISVTLVLISTGGVCTPDTSTKDITVKIKPSIIPTSQDQARCSGTAFNILPVNANGNIIPPNTLFTWLNPTLPSGLTGGSAQPISQTSISQTLTNSTSANLSAVYNIQANANGCSSTFSATITVKPKPTITSTFNDTICSGTAFVISPVNGSGNVVPVGTTYSWAAPINSNVNGLSSSTNSNAIRDTLVTNTYQNQVVTYTVIPTAAGCPGSSFNFNVTLLRKPNLVAIEDQQICSGSSVQLYAADLFGNQNLFYNWSQSPDASTLNFLYIPNPVASPSTNSSYVVSVIDPNTQCVATDSVNVEVVQVANLVISSSLSSLCEGDTAELSLNNIQADWYANGQLLASDASQVEVSPAVSTVYNAVFQSAACTVEDDLTLNVNSKPNPSINGNLTACENSYWQAYQVNSSDEHGYQWDVANGEVMSGQGTRNVLIHWFNGTEGELSVREVIWATGCDATADLTVNLNGLAPEMVPVTQLAAGSNVLVCEDSTFSIYNWGYESKTNPGALFLNVNTQYCNFNLLDPTNYYYFVEHGNDENCLTRSYFNEPAVVSGIEDGSFNNQGKLICWPNPAMNSITIGNLVFDAGVSQLLVHNALGALIQVKSCSMAKEIVLDVSDLIPGLYFIEVANSSSVKRVSFVKL